MLFELAAVLRGEGNRVRLVAKASRLPQKLRLFQLLSASAASGADASVRDALARQWLRLGGTGGVVKEREAVARGLAACGSLESLRRYADGHGNALDDALEPQESHFLHSLIDGCNTAIQT